MALNFKIQPERPRFGETVLLTAIEIIDGGFGREGSVWLGLGDGGRHPLEVSAWLPFGVEVVLPDAPPGGGPYSLLVEVTQPRHHEHAEPLDVQPPTILAKATRPEGPTTEGSRT